MQFVFALFLGKVKAQTTEQ